jgi:hypothetical protein
MRFAARYDAHGYQADGRCMTGFRAGKPGQGKSIRRIKAFSGEKTFGALSCQSEAFGVNYRSIEPMEWLGIHFEFAEGMKATICEHCDELITGKAYRVTSTENGIVLLDMTVCDACAVEAKDLQLTTDEIRLERPNAAILPGMRMPASHRLIG